MSTTLHLICGSTGAGKTTHALHLARELGAIHFSIDDWMVRLFGPDARAAAPRSPDWPWIAERIARCEDMITRQALELGRLGLSSILDIGLQRADRRRHLARHALEAGLRTQLHFVDTPVEERWRRVQARNASRGETFRIEVTRPMFDFIESIWQPPGEAEMQALAGVRIAA